MKTSLDATAVIQERTEGLSEQREKTEEWGDGGEEVVLFFFFKQNSKNKCTTECRK